MARVGYARVSSLGQKLEVQLEKLKECDIVFQEKRTGTTEKRQKLTECLNYVRSGDVLVITRLDRLARSTFHLTQIADRLNKKSVELEVIDQKIDTSTSSGRLLFNMLSSIAEFETAIRAERQMEGIKKAKEQGIKFGRKAKLAPEELEEMKKLRSNGVLIRELMKKYDLSKNSVYRLLRSEGKE